MALIANWSAKRIRGRNFYKEDGSISGYGIVLIVMAVLFGLFVLWFVGTEIYDRIK